MKFFNTAGPVFREDHYALDPLTRIDINEVLALIDQKKYFLLHAPRQTGKTSMLLALMHRINREGHFHCLYVNVETAQVARENVADAMSTILSQIELHAEEYLDGISLQALRLEILEKYPPYAQLSTFFNIWCRSLKKPLILFMDEIDALVGDSLISVLRQLRTGYAQRPKSFPQSIILCGVRDIQDYRIHASSEKAPITGGSAFNVKAESLRLGNFDEVETQALLAQHTQATGQVFRDEALHEIWANTHGQPWLVNALAYEVTYNIKANRDRSVALTAEMVDRARENLVQRRDTHIDQLAHKLKEPRVHRVIAPILAGDMQNTSLSGDDISYAYDLGLIETKGQLRIANPIYREVIPRVLTWPIQTTLSQKTQWFVSEETGLIDMPKLLTAFQQFYRENSEHWTDRYHYKEAGPQLLLQAFLQRVINGGGRIEREYGLGKGRTDLLVILPHSQGTQRVVLELKILKGSRQSTIESALPQITRYMDRCGTQEGHLVIFDRGDRTWEEKIFRDKVQYEDFVIETWGM